MPADLPPPFVCEVVKVHDGDTFTCRNGIKVRVAAVQAPDFTSASPCRRAAARRAMYTCDDRAARRSRTIVERLTLHKRLVCRSVDRSYQRVVARCILSDGRSLSCAVIAAGAGVRWDAFWTRYEMGGCR